MWFEPFVRSAPSWTVLLGEIRTSEPTLASRSRLTRSMPVWPVSFYKRAGWPGTLAVKQRLWTSPHFNSFLWRGAWTGKFPGSTASGGVVSQGQGLGCSATDQHSTGGGFSHSFGRGGSERWQHGPCAWQTARRTHARDTLLNVKSKMFSRRMVLLRGTKCSPAPRGGSPPRAAAPPQQPVGPSQEPGAFLALGSFLRQEPGRGSGAGV